MKRKPHLGLRAQLESRRYNARRTRWRSLAERKGDHLLNLCLSRMFTDVRRIPWGDWMMYRLGYWF